MKRHSRTGIPGRAALLLAAASLSVAAAAQPDRTEGAAMAKPRTILCLGDSITRGERPGVAAEETFCAIVQRELSRGLGPLAVINAGVGGQRTDEAVQRLERDVIGPKPDLVTVMYGTNDAAVNQGDSEPRLALPQYKANLERIVRGLRAAGITPVLMTPIPLGQRFDYMAWSPYKEHGPNWVMRPYVHAVREVALALDVPLVDHFAVWSERRLMGEDLDALMTDGCHPNPAGHEAIAAAMLPVLRKLFSRQP
jgi:lysophospholipase L1-like esterase